MVEIATKTCTRCGEEIDIDMMYFWLDIEFHEHIEDQDIGEPREDKNELLCQTCYTEFSAWFDTDVDTMEEWEEKRSEEVQNIFEV